MFFAWKIFETQANQFALLTSVVILKKIMHCLKEYHLFHTACLNSDPELGYDIASKDVLVIPPDSVIRRSKLLVRVESEFLIEEAKTLLFSQCTHTLLPGSACKLVCSSRIARSKFAALLCPGVIANFFWSFSSSV